MSAVEMLGSCRDSHCGATAISGKLCHAFTCCNGCMLTARMLCIRPGRSSGAPADSKKLCWACGLGKSFAAAVLVLCTEEGFERTGSGMALMSKVGLTAVLCCTHAMASLFLSSHRVKMTTGSRWSKAMVHSMCASR